MEKSSKNNPFSATDIIDNMRSIKDRKLELDSGELKMRVPDSFEEPEVLFDMLIKQLKR